MLYRYPAIYRVQALFGAMLAGIILLSSVLAEIESANLPDLFLHGVGFVLGSLILLFGVDFATRSIEITDEGLWVRWIRTSFVRWPQILDWSYLPLGLIHIRFNQGLGVFIWPLLDGYLDILTAIDDHHRITSIDEEPKSSDDAT